MVSAQSIRKQKQELLRFLRNNDIISVANRGVTTATETFDGDNVETEFTLTNAGVKNIRGITISSTPLTYGKDYIYADSVVGTSAITIVTFTTAPANGTGNISIQYDYGTGDKIYDDFPQDFVSVSSYPRIGFDIINSLTKEIAFSGTAFQSNKLIQINVYGLGKEQSENYLDTIRQLFLNDNDFYYWNFITVDNVGPTIETGIKGGKVFQRNIDLRAEFEFEC